MLRGLRAAFAFGLMLGLTPAYPAELIEEFDAAELDPEVWNTCQADPRLLELKRTTELGVTTGFLRNTIVEDRGNEETCDDAAVAIRTIPRPLIDAVALQEMQAEVEDGSDLGPSLIAPDSDPTKADECPRGGEYQRNELRLQPRTDLKHDLTDPHWYSIRFRTDGAVPACGSARWVIAQWKEPDGDSPFLAQRYDNGVLHVTVQNNDCRCMIAKAGGDPDRLLASLPGLTLLPSGLREVQPLKCVVSSLPDHAPEQLCTPEWMTVLTRGGRSPPELPDPRKGWVEMTYLVKGGSRGNGRVDVYSGGRFVVRVLGQIGYARAADGETKFKLGHYRSWVPGRAMLDVDRICVSRSSTTCDPDLRVPQ